MQIYADNAAFKPLLPEVKEVIAAFIDSDYCNPSAIYSKGRETRKIIERAREIVAKSIGADADEIYFTSGSTEAINWLFRSTGNHIVTSKIEHKAITQHRDKYDGCFFDQNVRSDGEIDMDGVRNLCEYYQDEVTVVIGWVNNEIGTIQPIEEIAGICQKYGSKLFIDATQAIGNVPINVHELGVDYLCGSGQKLGALSGCGFLYIKKGSELPPSQLGGAQERGMRAGTENILGIITLAVAIRVTTKRLESKIEATEIARDKILWSLLQIPKTHLNGGLGNRVCNNINIAFEGIEAESLVLQLDLKGVAVSAGSACNSTNIEPSHVLKAIGLSDELAKASIRITIDENITDEQVEYLINTIKDCVAKMRQSSPLWKEIENESD